MANLATSIQQAVARAGQVQPPVMPAPRPPSQDDPSTLAAIASLVMGGAAHPGVNYPGRPQQPLSKPSPNGGYIRYQPNGTGGYTPIHVATGPVADPPVAVRKEAKRVPKPKPPIWAPPNPAVPAVLAQTAAQKASIAQGALLSAHGARTNDWLEHRLNFVGGDVDPGIADRIRAIANNRSADIRPVAYVKSGKGRTAWLNYLKKIDAFRQEMAPIIEHGYGTGKTVRDTTVSPGVQAMIASLGSKVKKTGNKEYDDNATMLAAIGAQIKNPGSGAVDPWQSYDPSDFEQKQMLQDQRGANQIAVAKTQQGGQNDPALALGLQGL